MYRYRKYKNKRLTIKRGYTLVGFDVNVERKVYLCNEF